MGFNATQIFKTLMDDYLRVKQPKPLLLTCCAVFRLNIMTCPLESQQAKYAADLHAEMFKISELHGANEEGGAELSTSVSEFMILMFPFENPTTRRSAPTLLAERKHTLVG